MIYLAGIQRAGMTDEDESRARVGKSAQNLAVFRRVSLNLLKQDKSVKMGVKSKRHRADWDNNIWLT